MKSKIFTAEVSKKQKVFAAEVSRKPSDLGSDCSEKLTLGNILLATLGENQLFRSKISCPLVPARIPQSKLCFRNVFR